MAGGALMAVAKITYQWADGDTMVCEVRVAESYPDAVAEAKAQAVAMLRDGQGVMRVASDEDD
jgi:hypothetical protein